jgi:hypothetical protein
MEDGGWTHGMIVDELSIIDVGAGQVDLQSST